MFRTFSLLLVTMSGLIGRAQETAYQFQTDISYYSDTAMAMDPYVRERDPLLMNLYLCIMSGQMLRLCC